MEFAIGKIGEVFVEGIIVRVRGMSQFREGMEGQTEDRQPKGCHAANDTFQ
ncbi:MAG: hypothetical protein LBN33_02580 [Desulfovibrio sp.]|nr:hypothetical protein [Desulfovibrio sp.]